MDFFRKFRAKQRAQARPSVRDTNRDWQVIGAEKPFYGVLTDERFLPENLNEEAIKAFYRSGQDDVERMWAKMQELGSFAPKSVLDFGCGVGRLSIPLAEKTGIAMGVDISPGMIAEAQKRAPDGLTFANEIPDQYFDWVVSLIVFQHIPPSRGLGFLHMLLSRLSPHGGATIQLMFARTETHRGSAGGRTLITPAGIETIQEIRVDDSLPDGVILMHDYDMSAVLAEFFAAGMTRLSIEYCDHGGHVGATLYGIKGG